MLKVEVSESLNDSLQSLNPFSISISRPKFQEIVICLVALIQHLLPGLLQLHLKIGWDLLLNLL